MATLACLGPVQQSDRIDMTVVSLCWSKGVTITLALLLLWGTGPWSRFECLKAMPNARSIAVRHRQQTHTDAGILYILCAFYSISPFQLDVYQSVQVTTLLGDRKRIVWILDCDINRMFTLLPFVNNIKIIRSNHAWILFSRLYS